MLNNNRYKLLKIDNDESSNDEKTNDAINGNDDINNNDNVNVNVNINHNDIFNQDDNKINKFKKIIHRSNYTKKYHKIDKYNHKKILCQNFIINNTCSYDTKCLYAHSLSEQKIDIKRKKIFELLDDTSAISIIDPLTFRELNLFTRLCNDGVNHKCSGGYNCKLGAPMQKYFICYDDLNYGYCAEENCSKIHLTKRGLKPQYNNLNTNKPNISNIHMLIPFMNNLDILTNKINNSNIINDIIKDTDNDTDNDFDCLESIFIDKYKMIDCIN